MLLKASAAAAILLTAAVVRAQASPTAGSLPQVAPAHGGVVEGVVRDRSGAPVPGALVEARDGRPREIGAVWDAKSGVVRANTDAQGRFRLTGVGPGSHTLMAAARGRGRALRRSVRAGARVDLVLLPSASVTGAVAGPDGRPAAGARVLLEPAQGPVGSDDRLAVVDAAGRFEFPGVEPGSYRLVARHEPAAPAWRPVVISGLTDVDASLRLEPAAAVTGRLVDAQARPVRGRVGVLAVGKAPPPRALAEALATQTAADGTFRLSPLPVGSVALTVAAARLAPRRVDAQLTASTRELDLGTIALETGVTIQGFVRDRRGRPVVEARVTAEGATASEEKSAADGSFVLAGLDCTRCRVSVQAPGFATANREIRAGGPNVVVVLQEAGKLTGVVVDSAGAPVTGYRVVARAQPGPTRLAAAPMRRDVESADGRFTLENLAADTYVLTVVAPDRAPAGVSNVVVGAGETADVGEIRLGAGGTVRGTVVDAAGALVAGAVIRAAPPRRMMGTLAAGSETSSDVAGRFELRGVPTGSVRITASHPDYAEGEAVVDVEPAREPVEAQVVLQQGGRLQGRARHRNGSSVAGVVSIQSLAGGTMPFAAAEHVSIAPDGTFAADHVPAGRVRLVLMTGQARASGPELQAEVREGQTTPVSFDLREVLVSGRITRAGAPASGLRVTATSDAPAGPAPFASAMANSGSALTREDGTYELIADQPGRVRVTVEAPDGSVRLPARTALVPDLERHVLDLDFGGLVLEGVVVDEQTDRPLAHARVLADPYGQITRGQAAAGFTEADGRFHLEIEAGRYRVSARLGGYAGTTTDVEIGETGVSDLRLPLTRGGTLHGRVVDAGGQPAGDGVVRALSSSGLSSATAPLLPDGRFELSGLTESEYTLVARSDAGGFAVRPGVSSGPEEVALVLRRGGRIQLRLVGADGTPVSGASAAVSRVDGVAAPGMGGSGLSGADGLVTILSPAGAVEIRGAKLAGPVLIAGGSVTVLVEEGSTAAAEVVLAKPTAPLLPD